MKFKEVWEAAKKDGLDTSYAQFRVYSSEPDGDADCPLQGRNRCQHRQTLSATKSLGHRLIRSIISGSSGKRRDNPASNSTGSPSIRT
jgi:hypothetical protein